MSRLLRRLRAADPAAGFTLIEMTVAMFVFTIFGVIVLQISTSFITTSNRSTQRMNNIGQAEITMDRLTAEIRSAVSCACNGQVNASPIASADGNDITFYANLGGSTGPTKVQFTLSGSTLTESDYPASGGSAPTWTFQTTPQTKLVSNMVANTSAQPLFSYYQSGAATPIPSSAYPLTPTSSTSSSTVETVAINLIVQSNYQGSAVTLADQVHLLNVDYASNS